MQPLESPHHEVAPVAWHVELGRDGKTAGLLHLDLQVQGDRGRQHVEPGPEIGRRRGHAHQTSPPQRHSSTARSTASRSGSHATTWAACSSAVRGSLRPFPVSTHTTREAPPAPWARRPATLAADAGSQKTPSPAASNRYASRIWVSDTARTAPPDEVIDSIASSHRAGLPMRIALATVSGCSTGAPRTSGAAPSAWKPYIIGLGPASLKPRQ